MTNRPISKTIISPTNCPVARDTQKISSLSVDMVRAIRQLRRDLNQCTQCSINPDACTIRMEFNSTVKAAVDSIVDELDIAKNLGLENLGL